VYIFPGGGGGECGIKQHFWISSYFEGTGYKEDGFGGFYGFEYVVPSELYDCYLSQCYDGSEPDISMDLLYSSMDDTCGGAGSFDPCKFTAPELTVVGAP